jgi:predicted esterase
MSGQSAVAPPRWPTHRISCTLASTSVAFAWESAHGCVMVALCFESAIRTSVLLLPLLAAATGCAEIAGRAPPVATAPPGFSADTSTREGLISGATATEAGCRALPDGLWVSARGRRECLRIGASGMQGPTRTALVYIPGDPGGASYRFAGGRPYVERASEHYELSPETRDYGADALSGAMGGMPVFLMARPGMHGSSGNHARDRHTAAEVELMDSALTALRQRYGFQDFALFGFSSGGPVVANLLARRSDIRCAVIGSAPLDLALFYQRPDGMTPDHFAMRNGELADPMRTVRNIRTHAPIFVIGDRRDRSVPASAWDSWVAAARRAGLRVHSVEIPGLERPELGGTVEMHHQTSSRGMEVAQACATETPEERVLRALRSGEPILPPRGRELSGPEIRAALSGRRAHGTEWYPRVTISSHWAPDGVLSYVDLRNGEQRIGEGQWRVEGDRLCTTRHGCGEVFEDGRFLHLVRGEPPHLRITLVMAPPDPRIAWAGRP